MQGQRIVEEDDDDYEQLLTLAQLDAEIHQQEGEDLKTHLAVEGGKILRINVLNMNPLGIVQIIEDDTMIRMFGRDRLLYLKFLKYQSWFFLVIFMISWTTLMPTYYQGSDADKYIRKIGEETSNVVVGQSTENDINLLRFTILNVMESPDLLIAPYILTLIIAAIMYISIFCFWKQTTKYERQSLDRLNDMGYSQLHRNCLLIKGIPTHMAPSEARRHIKRILNLQLNKGTASLDESIHDVKVVEEFNEFFNLKKEL